MDVERNFEIWKEQVKKICSAHGYKPMAIASFDWSAWREAYYNEGLSAEDAVLEDERAAL
jgi:hypothetical protein